jgi:hypothetical protein
MLRIDLSRDQRSFLLISEDDHVITIPAKASALDLIKQLCAERHAGKARTVGASANPVQDDVNRYLARPFWDAEKAIDEWLEKNPKVKKFTEQGKPDLSLEDLDL